MLDRIIVLKNFTTHARFIVPTFPDYICRYGVAINTDMLKLSRLHASCMSWQFVYMSHGAIAHLTNHDAAALHVIRMMQGCRNDFIQKNHVAHQLKKNLIRF